MHFFSDNYKAKTLSMDRPVESHSGARESILTGPIAISSRLKHPADFQPGKLPTSFHLSTGLSFATRQLEASGGQSSAEGARAQAPNWAEGTEGAGCREGYPSPLGRGFKIVELKKYRKSRVNFELTRTRTRNSNSTILNPPVHGRRASPAVGTGRWALPVHISQFTI